MSNIAPVESTRHVTITAHQVTFDLVPRNILEEVFYAAIGVAWAADDGAYRAEDQEADGRMQYLQKAVSAASQFTVPVQREVEEPIISTHP